MIQIRPAQTADERAAVFRFRYSVYVEEMARPQKHADHTAKLIADPLDVPAACLLAAWESDQVVGTVRTNDLWSSDIGEYADHYGIGDLEADARSATSITTRLMVHPRHRRTTLATRLACETYRRALERGIVTDFIDCNAHLVEYFIGLGYCVHRNDLFHAEYGSVTVLRLDLTHLAHLESVHSPFRKLLRARNASPVATGIGS
jgi:GNAT superfamily N-acetyltransferase